MERGLEQSFEAEKLSRFIAECQDIDALRETAQALVQQLQQVKAASAWMATRASESENAKLEMLAEMIRGKAAPEGCSPGAERSAQDV